MSDHSSLGASGSRRWMNCSGSINLSKKALPDPGSVYADAGIAAHAIMERCLTNGVRPELFLDTIIQVEDMRTPVTVDEEMCEAVSVVLDYVDSRVADGAILLGVEVKFDLSPLNPPGPMYGRADVVLRDPGTKPQRSIDHNGNIRVIMPKPGLLEVIDFKFGQGTIVEVEGNSQLMYYALGAVVATDEIPGKIRVTVIQPRAPHPDGIVRSWEFEYEELKAFKTVLFERAILTQDEDAPLTVGDWCRFCPALAICPAQHERAQLVAQAEFSQVAVDVEHEQETALPVPEHLSLEQLQEVMLGAPVFDAFFKAVTSHLRTLTEAGEDTGYKLVAKRGRRMWNDEAQVEYEAELAGLGDSAYAPRKLKSVTQMEKTLKAEGGELPEDLWSMVSNGTNLVPLDDPRDALPPPPSARDDFEVVELEVVPDDDPIPAVVAAELIEGLEAELPVVVVLKDGTVEERVVTAEGVVVTEKYFSPVQKGNGDEIVVIGDEIVVDTWMIEAGEDNMFFVAADNEIEAREEARVYLGVSRLPNHTKVTPA